MQCFALQTLTLMTGLDTLIIVDIKHYVYKG